MDGTSVAMASAMDGRLDAAKALIAESIGADPLWALVKLAEGTVLSCLASIIRPAPC
jgi:hypothetical protein